MFNKVKTPEEGGVARDFFENRLDKSLLNHPDANILNIIINNRFIYPYYEPKSGHDKADVRKIHRTTEQLYT